MDLTETQEFCLSLKGVTEKSYGHPSNVHTYYVGRRKFAYFKTSEPERGRFSFRTSPDLFISLTDQAGIKPARYMHRFHWVTVVKVESVPSDYLIELITWSYDNALDSLPKKTQERIRAS